MINTVRTRIAPSPTGEDLHIGNVYTALINFVFAKKHAGKFIIRIEDTDRTRLVPHAEEKILSSLEWFGIIADESPKIGGQYAPYRQSERLSLYKEYANKLVANGHAYYCFCSPERLESMRKEQQGKGLPPMYDGLCKTLEAKVVAQKLKKEKYVIRLNVPDDGTTEFTDLVRGVISFENKLIDDQVILKSDGYPTYHLGVVVDDHLMNISHVIRAEEWISSTPKHILLYKFFGWELPVFAHGPILRNPDKSKLSKRKNPVWVSWYKEQGYLAEAIINYLALMGWSMPDGREIFSLDEMISQFRLEDVRPVGPAFDLKKLEWMCGEYIRKIEQKKLKKYILDFYSDKKLSQQLVEKSIPLIQERIKKLSEYYPMCEFLFSRPSTYEIDLSDRKVWFSNLIPELLHLERWESMEIGKVMQQLVVDKKYKSSDFFMAIRIGITGKKISPPLNDAMQLLGKDEVLQRLKGLA